MAPIKRLPKLPVAKSEVPLYPKPKDRPRVKQEAVKVYPGGREVCQKNTAGKHEYRMRTLTMAAQQEWHCLACWLPMLVSDVTFQHGKGRGMNGKHRDDRINQPGNEAWHYWCNAKRGSQRTV